MTFDGFDSYGWFEALGVRPVRPRVHADRASVDTVRARRRFVGGFGHSLPPPTPQPFAKQIRDKRTRTRGAPRPAKSCGNPSCVRIVYRSGDDNTLGTCVGRLT